MKPILSILISAFSIHILFSQTAALPKFESGMREKCHIYNPSTGDSLIYEIQMASGEKYLFKVFLKHYDAFGENTDDYCAVMDWISTSAKGGKGTIYVHCDALSESNKLVNFFFPGITMLKSNMSAIFLSRKSYHERREQSIYIDQKPVTLYELMGVPHADFIVKNKRKKYKLETYMLIDNNSMNYNDPSYKSEYKIWMQANARSPLIIQMELPQFTLTLKEIK